LPLGVELYLENVGSGKCIKLHSSTYERAEDKDGTGVSQHANSDEDDCKWKLVKSGEAGWHYLRSCFGSGRALHSPSNAEGSRLNIHDCSKHSDGTVAQGILARAAPAVRETLDRLCKEMQTKQQGVDDLMKRLDKNKDGILARVELSDGLRSLGITLLPSELDQVMKVFDKDGSGSIDYYDFHAVIREYKVMGAEVAKTTADNLKLAITPAGSGAFYLHFKTGLYAMVPNRTQGTHIEQARLKQEDNDLFKWKLLVRSSFPRGLPPACGIASGQLEVGP
jgi:hypothetical protein